MGADESLRLFFMSNFKLRFQGFVCYLIGELQPLIQ